MRMVVFGEELNARPEFSLCAEKGNRRSFDSVVLCAASLSMTAVEEASAASASLRRR